MLRVSKVPPGDPTTEQYADQNRFECLTCPYQFIIKKRFYERKVLPLKNVDDVIGGEGAWDGVEKARSMSLLSYEKVFWRRCAGTCNGYGFQMKNGVLTSYHSAMSQRKMSKRRGILVRTTNSQCRRAHDEFLQGVSALLAFPLLLLTHYSAQSATKSGANSQVARLTHASLEFWERKEICFTIYPGLLAQCILLFAQKDR
jgi:hypothetical protein